MWLALRHFSNSSPPITGAIMQLTWEDLRVYLVKMTSLRRLERENFGYHRLEVGDLGSWSQVITAPQGPPV